MSGGDQTSTQETKLPDWLNSAAKSNIQRADDISRIGYVPNTLAQVAAFSPAQESAFSNTNDMAGAFGMSGGGGATDYLPQAREYDSGVKGYGTWGTAVDGLQRLKEKRPAQFDAIKGMFMNPFTGEGGTFADSPLVSNAPEVPLDTYKGLMDAGVMDAGQFLTAVLGQHATTPLNEIKGDQSDADAVGKFLSFL